MKEKINEAKVHLMSGISYALPVIIAGSLIVAVAKIIGLIFGVTDLDLYADSSHFLHYVYLFQNVGWSAIGLLNYVLAGFIAYSIAGKPALGAGLVGGLLASSTNAGFLGAIIAGFFAGFAANWIKKNIKITGAASGTLPLIISPLITVGLTGILMGIVLAAPLSWINVSLLTWITAMCESNTNTILVAAILGAMIGFDLGGPVNKAAWMCGNALLMSGIYLPAIMTNVAICIPPLGYGLATLLKKKNYSGQFRESGKASLIMGIIGITEGAIPFTLKKPSVLIPLNVICCSIGSALIMVLGAFEKMPPVGGMYGFFTVGNGWAYLAGGLTGALLLAVLTNLLVDFTEEEDAQKAANTEALQEEIEISFD